MRIPDNKSIILFDAECNLCSISLQFIMQRDRRALFVFCSLQSPIGQRLLRQFGSSPYHLQSFVLIDNGKIYTRSNAGLRVLRQLGRRWNGIASLLSCIPKPIRDLIYDVTARYRYRLFGKNKHCFLADPKTKGQFLDCSIKIKRHD